MKFLLDTHVFLWFISGDTRLPVGWRDTIRQPHHEVYLSVVSLWETIIKHQLGRLPLPEPPNGICLLSVNGIRLPTCPWMRPACNNSRHSCRFTVTPLTVCSSVKHWSIS